MEKVLGLDLGTNSIGWAVIERDDENGCKLLDRGVHIFQEGVAREKNAEKPAVQDRTAARASRRHYFRRRLRKIELLKVLIEHKLCPFLSEEELKQWRMNRVYPLNDDFILWQRTDDNTEKNPYHDRYICLTRKLDLNTQEDRFILGRALYHLNQRRGFLSNRKEAGKDDESGKVKTGITELSAEIESAGCHYLGEFFYKCYGEKKIRTRYTAREEHYRKEFNAICGKQELSTPLIRALERAIFYQRPLKSQKGSVGKCTFEKDKPRCAVSHPRYEEFRMWQFLNSVRVNYLGEGFRPLSDEEASLVLPLFYRKSKPDFDFEELARKIAGKGNYAYQDSSSEQAYKFNYKMTTSVPGCPVTAAILSAIGIEPGSEWDEELGAVYTRGEGKNIEQILNDIWHALFSFDDESRLTRWLQDALQLDGGEASTLSKTSIPQGYASLSLKAINKILPWLRKGFLYSDSVFFANLPAVLPEGISDSRREEIEENMRICLEDFEKNPLNRGSNKANVVSDYLAGVAPDVNISKLYHPSMIETYPAVMPDKSGKKRLGTPRTNAFKNPMAMRALFRLRALINTLLDEGVIDPNTKINIEFARGLNDTNKRKAIEDYQRELEILRKDDRIKIQEEYRREFGVEIEPSESDLQKYRLYEEQDHICLYTGRQIGISQFLGSATEFDIEHTIPRSRGGDDSLMNKTLCESRFNRFTKKAFIPAELVNHEEIMQRVEKWKEKAEDFDKQIALQKRRSRNASSKQEKDNAIRRRHYLQMKRDYWKGKYERFVMQTVPDGFSNRQGVDIGIIGKYARLYLKTVFDRIYVVKGMTTADFRKVWGLQPEYEKKERINHAHHCIDAVTIACIGKNEYDGWKHYMEKKEAYEGGKGERPKYPMPWPTFTEDVLRIPDSLIVSHYTPDNMMKRSRKKLRHRGIIQRNEANEIKYCQGDSARALLHKDTFYGAIQHEDELKYVVRKSLDVLDEKDIKNIVDEVVREKVFSAAKKAGGLKKAVTEGIWMNEEKGIPIRKVRIFVPSVVSPIELKKHRDVSAQAYKRPYYVVNDSNYCMAVYGTKKPSFQLYTIMDAARNYASGKTIDDWVPMSDEDDRPLRFILKAGMMVLFYEKSPEELYSCSETELSKRLYKIIGMSSMTIQKKYNYGTISLRHHQEARPGVELKVTKGVWKNNAVYRPDINLLHTQLSFLVEGSDFILSPIGRIVFNPAPRW